MEASTCRVRTFASTHIAMRRVAYLWSEELMRVADALPANQGRSRLVHGLVGALGLVDLGAVREYSSSPRETDGEFGSEVPLDQQEDGGGAVPPEADDGRAQAGERTDGSQAEPPPGAVPPEAVEVTVLAPDPALCEPAELRRYHDASYVGELESYSQD